MSTLMNMNAQLNFNSPSGGGGEAPAGSPPENTTPPSITMDGAGLVGTSITSNNGQWTGSPTSFEYIWWKNGSDVISGENGSSLVLTSALADQSITLKVRAINAAGNSDFVESAPVTPAPLAVPSLITDGDPHIVHEGAVSGDTLEIDSSGDWNPGNPPVITTMHFRWHRDGGTVGTDAPSYATVADETGTFGCAVRAQNDFGLSDEAESNTIGVVAP